MSTTPAMNQNALTPSDKAAVSGAAHGSATYSPQRKASDNKFWLEQLRCRRDRIKFLKTIQTKAEVVTLLTAEEWYVEAQIEFRERNGGMDGVVIEESPIDLAQIPPDSGTKNHE